MAARPRQVPETEAHRAVALAVCLQRDSYPSALVLTGRERQARAAGQPEAENPASARISAAIGQIRQTTERAVAAREALEKEHSSYADRMAREAQIEIQVDAGHSWTPGQTESDSAEADYEPEL